MKFRSLEPTKVIFEHDGSPLLYVTNYDKKQYLVYAYEDNLGKSNDRFLVVPYNGEDVGLSKPLINFLRNAETHWLVEISWATWRVISTTQVKFYELDPSKLPVR